jgi:hypothetical protein
MKQRMHAGPWIEVAFLAACGFLAWKYYPRAAPMPEPAVATPAAPVEPVAGPPPVEYPIEDVPVLPEEAPAEPLPALGDSDAVAWAALAGLLEGQDLAAFLVPEFLVQRLVTTIDNLPRREITRQAYAARPVAGDLQRSEANGAVFLDVGNFARYDAAVSVFEGVDSRRLVSTYVRFYPLLQQAYREVAPPGRQFNDRLVEVIDHLLAAPEPAQPIALVPAEGRPRWEFADPALEQASIGHKALWRMGPDHAARVKAKLGQLRELLAAQRPRE